MLKTAEIAALCGALWVVVLIARTLQKGITFPVLVPVADPNDRFLDNSGGEIL